MQNKAILAINLLGGMDGVNLMSSRYPAAVTAIQTYRASAPSNILDYTEAQDFEATITKGSNTITYTGPLTFTSGRLIYGQGFERSRRLTITSSSKDEVTGITTIVVSGNAFETSATAKLTTATATQLFKMNETPPLMLGEVVCNPALHFNARWMSDKFNVKDTPENAGKTKVAFISNIGPMITKYYKVLGTPGSIWGLRTDNGMGGTRPASNSELVKNVTSHNDQQSTWVTNAPEGATKGWGGGIVDTFVDSITNPIMKSLASVSLTTGAPYSAGSKAKIYNASPNSLLLKFPGWTGVAHPADKSGDAVKDAFTEIIKQAAVLVPDNNDFYESVNPINNSIIDLQPIFSHPGNITNTPSIVSGVPSQSQIFLDKLKQILKLLIMNSPNRGYTIRRTGNVVTASTQVSNGTVTRAAGSTSCRIRCDDHGLFTSGTDTADLSDSVIITGLDATPPAEGYKITLVPGDEDNFFTVTSSANTALTDAPVTIRLKHNFQVGDRVFLEDHASALGEDVPDSGYLITETPSNVTLKFETVATGDVSTDVFCYVKLLNLKKQVIYTDTSGFSWDSHNSHNNAEIHMLDVGLGYFDSIVSRLKNLDLVGITMSDFGRTFSTNATGGTDHAWGNHLFVWGKSVKGNRIYGQAMDYDINGPTLAGNILLPTTSAYQYGATIAKWFGCSDAEVIGLFPKIVNWPAEERYLGFL
jgi:Protein of unknown function (DUF1501)